MDVYGLVGGMLGGVVASSALTPLVVSALRDRWMAKVKAGYEEEQKRLQAKLDQGNYVTQAQYDVEVSSYKDLFKALSELRVRWISYFFQSGLAVPGSDNQWLTEAWKQVGAANDAAVLVSGCWSPFYEKDIHTAILEATSQSTMFIQVCIGWERGVGQASREEAETRLRAICEGVEKVDGLVRERLSRLRLL